MKLDDPTRQLSVIAEQFSGQLVKQRRTAVEKNVVRLLTSWGFLEVIITNTGNSCLALGRKSVETDPELCDSL